MRQSRASGNTSATHLVCVTSMKRCAGPMSIGASRWKSRCWQRLKFGTSTLRRMRTSGGSGIPVEMSLFREVCCISALELTLGSMPL